MTVSRGHDRVSCEDVAPLGEGLVGGDEDWLELVAPGDDLVEEVGVAVVVGEVAELVDDEELWADEGAQAAGAKK